jgi:thioredoxin 1
MSVNPFAAPPVDSGSGSTASVSGNATRGATASANPNVGGASQAQAIAPFVDAERFTAQVEQTPGLAVVDFTADHCPPCRVLAPQVDALARELAGSVVVAKVDVEAQPDLTSRFGIRGTPTVLFFRNGQIVDRIVGSVPLARLRATVDALR